MGKTSELTTTLQEIQGRGYYWQTPEYGKFYRAEYPVYLTNKSEG